MLKHEDISILVEALPYLKDFKGKAIVIKFSGRALEDETLKTKLLEDVLFLQCAGMRPVIVHGGDTQIRTLLEQNGVGAETVRGLAVTDAVRANLTEMSLVGRINTELVARLNVLGGRAVGLNGKDAGLIRAKKHLADVYENGEVDLVDVGFVGRVDAINTDLLELLAGQGYIPVIAPTGAGAAGETYTIDADSVAGKIAGALKAEKLLVLTDSKGLYGESGEEASFLSTVTFDKAQELIIQGKITGGMLNKVRACMAALRGGARKAHIVDGRQEHALLAELFSNEGIGTEVVR